MWPFKQVMDNVKLVQLENSINLLTFQKIYKRPSKYWMERKLDLYSVYETNYKGLNSSKVDYQRECMVEI